MKLTANSMWPVLTSYDRNHLARLALPLGGIGTGTVSLGGRGDLRDWEIVNRPAKGFAPRYSFFALWARPAGGRAVTRAIEGPVDPPLDSQHGFRLGTYGLPRFRDCEFHAAYPFGQILLSDPDVPLAVRIEAFNPLVPCDADASGIPVAVLRFVLVNATKKPVAASVCGSVQNFVGTDGTHGRPSKNRNRFRQGDGISGLLMDSLGVAPAAEQSGTIALSALATKSVSHRTTWARAIMGGPRIPAEADAFWHDFSTDGRLDAIEGREVDDPMASLACEVKVPAGGTAAVTFLLTWCFPNRQTWSPVEGCCEANRIGNYYATQYEDAWDVAARTAPHLEALEGNTVEFVRSFCGSDLPDVVKEAALYNLSTLRTQTCFRTEDGRFYGYEGCSDTAGCCIGSCTHVWNYEQATAFLFGSLARSMREVEFLHATRDDGFMPFRVHLPLDRALDGWKIAAADGQMGCVMKLYRDWQLSGDDDFLRRLWPKARVALSFAWVEGGWDADQDGVMEGRQHNTTDLELYGPNPLTACWYLGALRAGEQMARHLGKDAFAGRCRALFERGSAWVDEHLFNGEYYQQEIRPRTPGNEAPGLGMDAWLAGTDPAHPPQQMGAGCFTDQLVGQFMAHVCGLGHLLDRRHVRRALKSIMKNNFRKGVWGHFNALRAFVVNDEQVLLYGTYPREREESPLFRTVENWTGVEYAAAVLMMQEGLTAGGLKVFRAIRQRFDGRKRSPFDEPECGHHYARAMASWAAVLALTGFRYSGVDRSMAFAAMKKPSVFFWSTGDAWGTFSQKRRGKKADVELRVAGGKLILKRIELSGCGAAELKEPRTLEAGQKLKLRVPGR